tara:strand:- start:1654 stop:2673 length:1020 start_codon:yes stop_codon:yes gene_type:complete
MNQTCLITGAAGFIGYHLSIKLLQKGFNVIGFDNLNSYYDLKLKKARLDNIKNLTKENNLSWKFIKGDLVNKKLLDKIFRKHNPKIVVNLAAQAGVRYSLENPSIYIQSNIVGFNNIIELSKNYKVQKFLYASSSSVYGGNKKVPFSEKDPVNYPVSLYAATKRSNELIAYTYSNLYSFLSIGIRFFTVYGPWGRPDMAPMIFTKSILEGKPIRIFNNGIMSRDFTYIDDAIRILEELICNPSSSIKNEYKKFFPDINTNYQIFNLGNSQPVSLMHFIQYIEKALNIKAIKNYEKMQPGDVQSTHADTDLLYSCIGIKPNTPIEDGIQRFITWYKDYYN